jgi:hypothetical protein
MGFPSIKLRAGLSGRDALRDNALSLYKTALDIQWPKSGRLVMAAIVGMIPACQKSVGSFADLFNG